MAVSFIKC